METSFYQSFKLMLLDIVHLSKDTIHVHIGLIAFFLAVVIWKKGRIEWVCLLPALLLTLLMEALDLRDDAKSLGHMRWSASFHDILNTLFWPVTITIWAKARAMKENRQ